MRRVPVAVQPMRNNQTDPHPKDSCKGPTAKSPIEAVIEPHPLISPVTVPRDLLFPWTLGWLDKSAATAEVMMLFGLESVPEKTESGEIIISSRHNDRKSTLQYSKLTLFA